MSIPRKLCVVHPDVYLNHMRCAENLAAHHQRLMGVLGNGGDFRVVQQPDGTYVFSRLK